MKLPFRTAGFPESNISQRDRNNCKQKNNTSKKIYFGKIHNSFLLKMYATTNATIPSMTSAVNTNGLDEGSIPGNIGETMAAPNQNTEKLIRKSEATERKIGSNLNIANKFTII